MVVHHKWLPPITPNLHNPSKDLVSFLRRMGDAEDFTVIIQTLERTSDAELCSAWQKAFADYAMSATESQLLAMFKRRGYTPEMSVCAIADKQIVSMTLNGIGSYNGMSTAYDTSTGTVKEYRRKGLAKRLFQVILPILKQKNVQQYILEVLSSNVAAKSLYLGMGFTITREFCFFRQPARDVQETIFSKVEQLDRNVSQHARETSYIEIDEVPEQNFAPDMWDFHPSWQNSTESMKRSIDTLKIVAAYRGDHLVGYGIVEPATGDIPQLAVDPRYRRQGTGTFLLKRLLTYVEVEAVKVINVDITCQSLVTFLKAMGMTTAGGQYEMQLLL